ncbi:hypothetical protein [Nonomuraea sp. NPDC049607]|uniref:hypothetical protein n=1 Tax=Nonomuraea sp. NPDC049607 TaxID=3154732 RepID=UPI003412BAE9
MSTNERDWFAPRNDQQAEDPSPSAFPPPPPPPGPATPPGPPAAPASPAFPAPGQASAPEPQAPLPARPPRPRRRRTASPSPNHPTPPPGYGMPGAGAPGGPRMPEAPQNPAQGPFGQGAPAAGAGFGQGASGAGFGGQPAAGHGFGQQGPERGRYVHPDQQVWPPAPRESSGGRSTQPLPAIRPGMTMPSPQRAPGTAPGAAPGAGSVPPEQPPAPQEPPQPSRGRLVLVAVGAVVASVVAMGLTTYDGYVFYDTTITDGITVREISVAPGQSGKLHDIEWKAALSTVPAPQGSKHGPEVTWLKVDITQKLLDEGSATMTAAPGKVKLEDRAGRSWTVEFEPGDRPTDRLELGKEYKIEGMAIVPTPVANEVELSFTPSDYRSDTPTADFFKREKAGKPEADVLRFRRR